jgi:hypothetical protein
MNDAQINMDLVRALGITDTKSVRKVTLVIEAGTLPTISVERFVRSADGLQTAVEMLNLKPVNT